MSLTDKIFGPAEAEPEPITAEQRAARIHLLTANTTAAHDLANFWRDHANPVAQAGELRRMDECLDGLLDLGVGR